jgi:hypothetical protein
VNMGSGIRWRCTRNVLMRINFWEFLIFITKSTIEVLYMHVTRMILCYWTGGTYIGILWKNGLIWCTAGYIAVEW